MTDLVYATIKHLASGDFDVELEDNSTQDLSLRWGSSVYISIPRKQMAKEREKYQKLHDFLGQVLQDIEVTEKEKK